MTFEQQVWDLLCAVAIKAGMSAPSAIAGLFAPRVAAAISAAHGSQGNKARELLQQKSLAALRGEMP